MYHEYLLKFNILILGHAQSYNPFIEFTLF